MQIAEDFIYPAIDKISSRKFPKSPEINLSGENSIFDSWELFDLIRAIEEQIETKTGLKIAVANEDSLSQIDSPFETVASLENYIANLLEKHQMVE